MRLSKGFSLDKKVLSLFRIFLGIFLIFYYFDFVHEITVLHAKDLSPFIRLSFQYLFPLASFLVFIGLQTPFALLSLFVMLSFVHNRLPFYLESSDDLLRLSLVFLAPLKLDEFFSVKDSSSSIEASAPRAELNFWSFFWILLLANFLLISFFFAHNGEIVFAQNAFEKLSNFDSFSNYWANFLKDHPSLSYALAMSYGRFELLAMSALLLSTFLPKKLFEFRAVSLLLVLVSYLSLAIFLNLGPYPYLIILLFFSTFFHFKISKKTVFSKWSFPKKNYLLYASSFIFLLYCWVTPVQNKAEEPGKKAAWSIDHLKAHPFLQFAQLNNYELMAFDEKEKIKSTKIYTSRRVQVFFQKSLLKEDLMVHCPSYIKNEANFAWTLKEYPLQKSKRKIAQSSQIFQCL